MCGGKVWWRSSGWTRLHFNRQEVLIGGAQYNRQACSRAQGEILGGMVWHGKPAERNHFEIFGDGMYIHWPDLDEDLTVAGLLAGLPSGESQKSLKQWLKQRDRKKRKSR
jgi:Protein of unknown function (DUF2442)